MRKTEEPDRHISRAKLTSILTSLERGTGTYFYCKEAFSFGREEFRIGVTGMPGAGKSTIINRLITLFREGGENVGALLFDPASPKTGGSVLGDRARMQGHATDRNVFIRSLSNRGRFAVNPLLVAFGSRALAAAGFRNILIESVGVGQSEGILEGLVDLLIVVLPSDFGDKLQIIKAGILETGDILAVNKADLPASRSLFETLKSYYSGKAKLMSVSGKTGENISLLFESVVAKRKSLFSGKISMARRDKRIRDEIMLVLREKIDEKFCSPLFHSKALKEISIGVLMGEKTIFEASEELLVGVLSRRGSRF